MTKKLNKLVMYSIMYIIIAIAIVVMYFFEMVYWYFLIMSLVLVVVAIVFLVAQHNLRLQQYCKYIRMMRKLNEIEEKRAESKRNKSKKKQ